MTYYLTVEEGPNSWQTEPVTVMPEAPATDGATKYERINQMLADKKLGKDQDLVRVMRGLSPDGTKDQSAVYDYRMIPRGMSGGMDI